MRGAAEHRAGAVIHQHEIGDEQRQLPVRIERMDHREASIIALLFGGLDLGGGGAGALALGDERLERRIARGERLGDRMIGGDRREACAEQRVGARREHLEALVDARRRIELEGEAHALRLADPVLLHRPDLFGPLVERGEAFEQVVGEVGDLEEPLAELAPLDQRAGAPAAPVDHLLVGEHGHVDRIPVDRRFLAVDEARRIEIEEQRLLLAVIIGLAGGEFAAPVEREADPLELGAHRRDVGPGPVAGMDLLLHRGIFGGHAERVPAHRVEHFIALHPPVPGEHVAHRVVADMAHMDAPRRIGEHLEDVALRLGTVVARTEGRLVLPDLLPVRVGLHMVETRVHGMDSLPSRQSSRDACRAPWSG